MIRRSKFYWLRFCLLFLVTVFTISALHTQEAKATFPTDSFCYSAELNSIQNRLERMTGYALTKPVCLSNRETDQVTFLGRSSDEIYARTDVVSGDLSRPESFNLASRIGSGPITDWDACLIVLSPRFEDLPEGRERQHVLAHELAHCYQSDRMGGYIDLPEWMAEGTAEWMGQMLINPTRLGAARWQGYLRDRVSLQALEYNAVGFFGHLEYQGAGVWDLLDRYFANGAAALYSLDEAGKFDLLLNMAGTRNHFLETWAMGLERNARAGRDWDTDGPNIGETRRPSKRLAVPSSQPIETTTQHLWEFDIPRGQITTVTVENGYGGIRFDNETERFSSSFSQRYCVEGACECEGRPIEGVTTVASPHAVLALTADFTPGQVTVEVEEVPCEEETARPGVPPAGDGEAGSATGRSFGDPHIITYDGYRYSFQTVGEFVLSQSVDGHFEVQARQKQVPDRSLSLNTAAAMSVDGHRVVVYAQDAPDGSTPLWIDGVPTTLENNSRQLGGGAIRHRGDRNYTIDWPTGEQVVLKGIRAGGQDFMNISPTVPRGDAGEMIGLLGDFNGKPGDDLRSANGQVVPSQNAYAPVTQLIDRVIDIPIPLNRVQTAFFEQLYRQFGDSWRISSGSSLFDYAPGQSTETFTNRAFPDRFPSLVGIAPAQIQEATRLCQESGIAATLMEGCVFDIAATGDSGFLSAAVNAIADAAVQEVTDRVVDEVRDAIPIPLPQWPF